MKYSQLLRALVAIATVAVLGATTLPAQRLGPPPKRPKAGAVADTNDARQYLDYAMSVFEKDPSASAAGFYWAARIDPTSATALYGRSMALTLSNRGLLNNMMSSSRRRNDSKDQRAVDSLRLRALMIDPFLFTPLEKRLFKAWLTQGSAGSPDEFELNYEIERYLRNADPYTRGWVAYSEGSFARALSLYAEAMKSAKEKAGYRVERGRTFSLIGNADSAIAEFDLALDELRKRDNKDIVVMYNSKAVLEHSIGTLMERSQNIAGARTAYGKALQEDLSYYPAHLRLGLLSIDAGDTTTALSELDLAAQIAVDEPQVHFIYGFALSRFGKNADAIRELNKAITLEPFYARPYEVLAEILEKTGDRAGAIAAYDKFLAYASQGDVGRPGAVQKRAALGKSLDLEIKQ